MRGNDFNLNKAIANLADAIGQNQSLTIRLDIQLPPLPIQVGHQLYCIIQEGLTNIQKHFGAEIVTLTGQYDAETITLMLQDNGRGFRPQVPPMGFGIRGMKERTQILGGQFTIHSAPGDGTWIQVVIPYLVAS